MELINVNQSGFALGTNHDLARKLGFIRFIYERHYVLFWKSTLDAKSIRILEIGHKSGFYLKTNHDLALKLGFIRFAYVRHYVLLSKRALRAKSIRILIIRLKSGFEFYLKK